MKIQMLTLLLLLNLLPTVQADPLYIDDFDGNNLGWTWSTGTTTQNYTAEASSYGLELAPAGGDTYSTTSEDWDDYQGYYLGFYLYGTGSATLDVIITEEDPDGANGAETQPWDLISDINIDWVGWKYIMRQLPNGTTYNDFQATATSQEPTIEFNPVPGKGQQNHEGVISIQFNNKSATNTLYIDEINLCQCLTIAGVLLTFPQNGDSSFRLIPPTISAVCDMNTDVINAFSAIFLAQQDENLADGSYYSIDNLISSVANDGVGGLFATPNDMISDAGGWGAYQEGASFVMFIRPANSSGDIGQANVITFSVYPPPLRLKTRYHREVTE